MRIIDLDYSVMNLLKVAAYLHSKSSNNLNIEHFLEECKWAYEHRLKDENN